jgi:hypothetical protein
VAVDEDRRTGSEAARLPQRLKYGRRAQHGVPAPQACDALADGLDDLGEVRLAAAARTRMSTCP